MQSGAQLLAEWIARRGIKQKDAADLFGLSESLVSMFVNGKRRPPLETAVKIARLTGIPVEAWASSPRDKSKKAIPGRRRQAQRSQSVNTDAA